MYWQVVFLDPYRRDGIEVAALQSAPVSLSARYIVEITDKPCLFSAEIYSIKKRIINRPVYEWVSWIIASFFRATFMNVNILG